MVLMTVYHIMILFILLISSKILCKNSIPEFITNCAGCGCPFGYHEISWMAERYRSSGAKCQLYRCYLDSHCQRKFGPHTWCGFEHGQKWDGCRCEPNATLHPRYQKCVLLPPEKQLVVSQKFNPNYSKEMLPHFFNPQSEEALQPPEPLDFGHSDLSAKPVAIPLVLIFLFVVVFFAYNAFKIEQRQRRQNQECKEQMQRNRRLRRVNGQNPNQFTSIDSHERSDPETLAISLTDQTPNDLSPAQESDQILLVPLASDPLPTTTSESNSVTENQNCPSDSPPSYAEALGEANLSESNSAQIANRSEISHSTPPPSYYSLSTVNDDTWV